MVNWDRAFPDFLWRRSYLFRNERGVWKNLLPVGLVQTKGIRTRRRKSGSDPLYYEPSSKQEGCLAHKIFVTHSSKLKKYWIWKTFARVDSPKSSKQNIWKKFFCANSRESMKWKNFLLAILPNQRISLDGRTFILPSRWIPSFRRICQKWILLNI